MHNLDQRNPLKIGIDIDEVLADFLTGFLPFFEKHTGRKPILPSQISMVSLAASLGVTLEEEQQIIKAFEHQGGLSKLAPVSGATEAIECLSKRFQLEAITLRRISEEKVTRTWLQQTFGSAFAEVHLNGAPLNAKEKMDKSAVCISRQITIFVEDHPEIAMRCASKGIHTLLMRRPWNQHIDARRNLVPVSNWNEATQAIDHFEKQNRCL